ncbi:MAG TPA: hypothetical protein DD438_05650 [Verrucomicrobiales bacterium]|nr:hypothetical protein [Verrucomicrobiales bacterium]
MRVSRHYAAALVTGALALALPAQGQSDPSRDALIVETILRIEGFDLSSSTKAQGAVNRYLKENWGGERYLDLIKRFNLQEEAPGLLRLALKKSETPAGAEAATLLVSLGKGELLAESLQKEDEIAAGQAAKAIAHTGDTTLMAALPKVLANPDRPLSVRSSALAALYGKDPGSQSKLLAMVKSNELAEDLRQTASEILMLSRNPEIREEAKTIFSVAGGDYPSIAELLKRKGDPSKGKELFITKTCMICHEAGGTGINFGPGLSQIGDKLDAKALYQAILQPSEKISMGFEGWEVTLKNKTKLVGIIEETEENLTLTMIGGAKQTIEKGEITSRSKMKQSLMYPGLHQLMTPEELADLVSYLSSLRKGD